MGFNTLCLWWDGTFHTGCSPDITAYLLSQKASFQLSFSKNTKVLKDKLIPQKSNNKSLHCNYYLFKCKMICFFKSWNRFFMAPLYMWALTWTIIALTFLKTCFVLPSLGWEAGCHCHAVTWCSCSPSLQEENHAHSSSTPSTSHHPRGPTEEAMGLRAGSSWRMSDINKMELWSL